MMMKSSAAHYLGAGLSGLRAVQCGVPELAAAPPRRVLDFGCGFGRVTRFLQAEWPEADVNVCDVDFTGLAFCLAHLGVRGFQVGVDPAAMRLGGDYDLIWVGSVVTHLDAPVIMKLLAALAAALAPGGHVCFSSHGDLPVGRLKSGERYYGLAPPDAAAVVAGYETSGFGYANYLGQVGYGISASSQAWLVNAVAQTPGLAWCGFQASGWDNYQDIVVCRRDA